MWFGKNIITKVGLALAMAVPAFAADVAPLYFENVESGYTSQDYWNLLTKYKLWGSTGISMGTTEIPDKSGWVGTAAGNMTGTNANTILGGPILIGGNISLGDGTKFVSGPTRTTGSFTAGNDNGSEFHGTTCVAGTVNQTIRSGVTRAGGTLVVGEGATENNAAWSGSCIVDSVPGIKSDLRVPAINPAQSYQDAIVVGDRGVRYVDVPPGGSREVYDIYLKNIQMGSSAHLYVRMQNHGRLTRFFLNNFTPSDHPNIQVVYMDSLATFSNGRWYGTETIVPNKDYAGHLMFYVDSDINFSNTDNTPMQGTFISKGQIKLVSNVDFAGQLIADFLDLGNQINGGSFIYVPFDPPILKLEPELGTRLEFPENNTFVKVPIKLDTAAKVDVFFDYCFEVTVPFVALELDMLLFTRAILFRIRRTRIPVSG